MMRTILGLGGGFPEQDSNEQIAVNITTDFRYLIAYIVPRFNVVISVTVDVPDSLFGIIPQQAKIQIDDLN